MYNCFIRHFLLLIFVVLAHNASPQSANIDSLKSVVRSQRDTLQVNSLVQLSYALLDDQRADSALHYASRALALSLAIKFNGGIMRSHFALGRAFQEKEAYKSAMKHFIECLSYADESGNQEGLFAIYLYLGKNHRLRAESAGSITDIPEALRNYRRALKLSSTYGKKELETGLSVEMGYTFRHKFVITQDKIDQDSMLYYFNEALAAYREAKDTTSELSIQLDLGSLYLSSREYEEAERRMLHVISLAERHNRQFFLPVAYSNLGVVYFALDNPARNPEKSLRYKELALDAGKKFGGPNFNPVSTYFDMGGTYLELKKFRQAIKYFELSLESARTTNLMDSHIASANAGLADAYYGLGDFKKAIDFQRKFSHMRDSLSKEVTSAEMIRLQNDFEQSRETEKIERLEQEASTNKVIMQRTRTIQYLIAGILLITVFAIIVLTNQYRIVRRAKKTQEDVFRQVDALKSRFFANISHEFRTPLTLLLGPIEKRLSNATESSDKKELSIMHSNASRLLTLVNQLLDLSRLESGSLKLQCRQLNLNKLIDRVSSQFASMADSKTITYKIDAAEDINLFADAEKMEKIITNLLSNAFKFTATNGTIHLIISRRTADKQFPSGAAEIMLKDTGIGIDKDELPKIFERFYQVDNTTTRHYEGSGIGLALVKELVDLHRGSIVAESIASEGTCFTILLPLGKDHLSSDELASTTAEELSPVQTATLEHTLQEVEEIDAGPSMPKLLVVEDNADLRYYLRSCLSNKYSIVESPDGNDGYQKALELIPDIIVTDLMMPGIDGIELCKKLKADEKTSHIPIILLTAKADHFTKLEGLRTGADDYITKPFSQDELVTRVHNLIAIRRNLQKKYSGQLRLMPSQIEVESMEDRFLKKVMTIIEQHIDDQLLSVDMLAEEAAMSNTQLYRKLKSLTGFSPNELIRNTRLERAASLLKQRAGTVADVAYQVGFNNLSYFSKCFKEKFGLSPSEFTLQKSERG